MTEDRSWQYRSGHCLQLGKPNCRGCTVDDCTCPSDWCVAKRSEPAKNKGNERVSEAPIGENVGTSKDEPQPRNLAVRSRGSNRSDLRRVIG